MLETVALVLSLLLLGTGILTVLLGYRSYSVDQRTRARGLWRAYVAGNIGEAVIGLGTTVWIVTQGLEQDAVALGLVVALALVPTPVTLVRWKMRKTMDRPR